MDLVIAMGRIKQFEKNVKKVANGEEKQQRNELKNLAFVILAVIVIFIVFTIITSLINPKKTVEPTTVIEETIQYDKILVGEILNRDETNYYVLVKNNDNVYNELYSSYLDIYVSENKDSNYYVVDLDDAFNKNYVADETKVSGNDISKYEFSNTTLIKIKKNKIDKVYASHETILTALEKLIK